MDRALSLSASLHLAEPGDYQLEVSTSLDDDVITVKLTSPSGLPIVFGLNVGKEQQ